MDKQIFINLQWSFVSRKIKEKHTNRLTGEVKTKTICMSIQELEKSLTTKSNNYIGLESDELVEYGDYQQPWKLGSGASGNYCSPKTGLWNRRKKRNRIKVQVEDGENINQIQEGKAPFDRLPEEAADVHIFPNIPNP